MTFGMIHFSLILHHNMGMKYAEQPFNMAIFFYLRRLSKWLHFQTLNTHIREFLYWSRPPPWGFRFMVWFIWPLQGFYNDVLHPIKYYLN